MKRLSLIKLLSLILCIAMTVSFLAACDGETETTASETDAPTEAPTDAPTEAPTDTPTETPTAAATETSAEESASVTAEAPTEEPTDEPTENTAEAPTEAPTQTPTEPETSEAPTEPETTESPTEPETSEAPTEEETTEEEPTEAVTDCGGKHAYWQTNSEGHYRDACPYCGGGAVELKEHSFDIVEGMYRCVICKYSPWTIDAEGHTPTGDPEAEKELHFFFTFGDGYYCYVCKYVPECGGVHSWIASGDGHAQAACEECGAETLPLEPHDSLIEVADGNKYTYMCTKCEHVFFEKEIGAGVEAYMSAHTLIDVRGKVYPQSREDQLRPSTFYSMGGRVFDIDGNVPYFGFTMGAENPSAAQWLWVRNDPAATSGASAHEKYSIDIGEAKYAVMKIRTNNPLQSLKMTFSTEGADGRDMASIPLSVSSPDEWVTYIIDLAAVYPDFYAKAENADTYKIDDFYFHIQPFTTDTYLNFSYIAFVSGGWEELDGLIDDERAVIMTSKSSNALVNVKDGTCVDHSSNIVVDNGEYVSKCAVCGTVERRYGISADAATGFMPETAFTPREYMGGSVDSTFLADDDGTSFVRFDNFIGAKTESKNPWSGINIIGSANPTSAGRYMVLKVRVGENGLGQTQLKFYMSTEEGALKDESQGLGIKIEEDGEWHTIVVDLSARVGYTKEGEHLSSYLPATDGSYTIKFMQLRLFHLKQYGTNEDGTKYSMPEADDYTDIAYIAFFDSLDDVANVIDGDTYELSVSATENVVCTVE